VTRRKPRDPYQIDSLTISLWVDSRSLMMMSSSFLKTRHLLSKLRAARARKEGSPLPQSLVVSELEFQSPNKPRNCSPLVLRRARERVNRLGRSGMIAAGGR
jgi:hypothetical protein